jgi:MoaA/NifB/PqqE/SkfB family radical SAM enzyme
MRMDGQGAGTHKPHEQAGCATFGNVDEPGVLFDGDAFVLFEPGKQAFFGFAHDQSKRFRGAMLMAQDAHHFLRGLNAFLTDAHIGLSLFIRILEVMRFPFAFRNTHADHIKPADLEDENLMCEGRVAQDFRRMTDVFNLAFLAVHSDNALVIVNAEQHDSPPGVGKCYHLPRNLDRSRNLSLEFDCQSFALVYHRHDIVKSHTLPRRFCRVVQYPEKHAKDQAHSRILREKVFFVSFAVSSHRDCQLTMPILCNYYLTYRCNAYCDFCHFGDHAAFRDSRHADTSTVLRNLPDLRTLGVRFIDLTGGEPLLHPELDVIARAAKASGMVTSITTNGLLYAKYAERLRGLVDLLHFSLDSDIREQHDGMRGVPCYDAVMASLDIAARLGETPDLLFTVTEQNYTQLMAVYEIAAARNLMLLINPVFEYFRVEDLSENAFREIERVAKRPMAYLNPAFLALRRRGGNDPEHPLCRAASRVIVISPDNHLLLPCYHQHMERLPIDDNLFQLWQSDRVAWHREHEGRHAFCKGCSINCYFEPSFAFPVNAMSLMTVPSKIKYGYAKFVLQPLRKL